MGIEAIAALAGIILPPAVDLVKKVFVKPGNDTPEQTMNSLAVSNPETLPQYISALSELYGAKTGWFNRDVIGTPSQWVIDIRACIRPLSVIAGLLIIAADMIWSFGLDANTKAAIWANNGSWFGSRLVKD